MQVKIFSGVLPHVEVEINRWLYAHPMVRVVRMTQTEREADAEAVVDALAEVPVVTITLLYAEDGKPLRWWMVACCWWRWRFPLVMRFH